MKQKLLIVEDEFIIALATKRELESFGFEAATAYTGEMAVRAVAADTGISLVLMDIDLGPGMDGPEAAQKILAIRSVPIVFLTSHSEPEMVEKVRGITRYGYVLKSSGDFVLRSSIEMAYELFTANRELEREKERLRTTLNSIGDAVLSTDAEGRVVGMNPVAERLTGWSHDEAKGRPVDEVFHIVKRDSGEPALNPISRVRETGLSQDLANYTELISRGGERFHISDSAAPIKDAAGHVGGMVLVFSDVSEKQRIEAALKASEERFRLLFRNLNSNFALHEILRDDEGRPVDYRFLEVNPSFEAAVGMKAKDIIGRTALELFPQTESYWIERFGEVASTGQPIRYENYSAALDRYYQMNVYSPKADQFAYLVLDTTDLRKAVAQSETLLAERDLLLKEIHHRVKNNMHSIVDLLALQAGSLDDRRAATALEDAGNRVRSMFLLYEKIYEGPSYTEVAVGGYLSSLIDEIVSSFPQGSAVTVDRWMDDFMLDAKRLQALGILLNELITNSMKHAFAGKKGGRISVELRSSDGKARLSVRDDGIGLPAGMDGSCSRGIGLSLVEALAAQLSATLRIDRSGGTGVHLEFSL